MSSATLSVRVARKTTEAQDIMSLELVPAAGGSLPAFSAGSHIDVQVPDGHGGHILRQYSLCNSPADTQRYVIAVLRDPASRGGSSGVHERLQVGDLLTISAPRNHFALAPHAQHHLLIAGGIGITPLLSMAEALAAAGASFALHYASRTPERTAFRERLAQSPFAAHVHHHYSQGDAAQKLDLQTLLRQPLAGIHVYVCGPQRLMDAVLKTARTAGWPDAQIHHEFFGATVAPSASDGAFEVVVKSSGQVVPIPADKTVVQALAAAGVSVMISCEQGVCGTCLTRVLEGVPDHKDHYLTPEEQASNDQFTPCCSRSKTPRLVLDL
jgi:vanillate O-demethylase ferredoxin subunit